MRPDGRRGLEVIQHGAIDIAFVDFEMPVMNGLEFLSSVRALTTANRFMPMILSDPATAI